MNGKYDNNQFIIASRPYFQQFISVLVDCLGRLHHGILVRLLHEVPVPRGPLGKTTEVNKFMEVDAPVCGPLSYSFLGFYDPSKENMIAVKLANPLSLDTRDAPAR